MSGSVLLSSRLIPGCPETPPDIKTRAPKSRFYIRGRGGPSNIRGKGLHVCSQLAYRHHNARSFGKETRHTGFLQARRFLPKHKLWVKAWTATASTNRLTHDQAAPPADIALSFGNSAASMVLFKLNLPFRSTNCSSGTGSSSSSGRMQNAATTALQT